ncbi:hypothetical protein CNYM01_07840 [Colletotrichum nymphaeae SA-01]|uniref:Uncharacterized protein n=1 Tax=Colletotrichum nymphaeae SA-01 TaxID=1460502 RepID=A0A135SGL4_9PEZI|nr:hypothetical protein CNYM01_07840 [Colletotrichum nymphaeae SA-01]
MEGAVARHRQNGQADAIKNKENNRLPERIRLAETRLRTQVAEFASEDPSDAFSQCKSPEVVVLNDPGNSMIVTLLKRCHRRYTGDTLLSDDAFYVGINAIDFTPAFISSVGMSSLENNTYDDTACIGSSRTPPSLIVPPVDMLRSQQLIFLKELSRGQSYGSKFRKPLGDEVEGHRVRQQDAFDAGHACPVLIVSGDTVPDYAAISDTQEGGWRNFRMMMPKIKGMPISKGLMDEIDAFLGKYDRDIVPPNFALILAIIYHDCYHALELRAEKELLGKPMAPVPLVSLAQMILYGPHYFRIHEELKLSAYVHIFRAVDYFYGNDKKLGAFTINDEDINTDLVFKYIDEMGLEKEDWLEIVSPSWEGSQLLMPLNHAPRIRSSPELTAMLMMPDIYTLGFAGYTNELEPDSGSATRDTLMHGLFVPKHIRSIPDLCRPIAERVIYVQAFQLYRDQLDCQMWSAPKMSVRSPWSEVATIDSSSSPHIEDTQVSSELEAEDKNAGNPFIFIKTIRQGQNAGLIDKSVTIGPDGYLTWPGLENQPGTRRIIPGRINIQKLIAEYDTAEADRISEIDRRILQRLFETDLAHGKHVAKCARELKARIRIGDEDLGKAETGDMHADQIIASCAELLGVDVTTDDDGNVNISSDDAIAAIREVDGELANALTTFTWLVTHIGMDGTEPVFKLTTKLMFKSRCFDYWNRLTLFGAHIQSQPLNEKAKERWARFFEEPYRGGDDGDQ